MDPVSIIGLIASVASIFDLVGKSISKLSDLRSRYRDAPLQITTLIGQLYMIQAAITELDRCKTRIPDHSPRHEDLARTFNRSLDFLAPLIQVLQQYLDTVDATLTREPDSRARISHVWNEKEIGTYSGLLDRQVNALSLLLQAMQCNTWADQIRRVEEEDSRTVLHLARDCSSSLAGLSDGISVFSDNTNTLSLAFDFDAIILSSKVYQSAQRSHLKQAIRADRHRGHQETGNQETEDGARRKEVSTMNTKRRRVQGTPNFANKTTSVSSPIPGSIPSTAKPQARNSAQDPAATTSQTPQRPAVTPTFDELSMSSLRFLRISTRQVRSPTIAKPQPVATGVSAVGSRANGRTNRKILVLGSSESGRSTLIRAMRMSLGPEYSTEERLAFSKSIFTNIVASTGRVLDQMALSGESLKNRQNVGHVPIIARYSRAPIQTMTEELADALHHLWGDACFRRRWTAHRYHYDFWNNDEYFATHIHRLAAPTYVPSDQDIACAHRFSSYTRNTTFENPDFDLDVYDCAGSSQRRKAWTFYFQGTSAVVFTADVTAWTRWSKVNLDGSRMNMMDDQLLLFDSLVNSYWFSDTSFILVFTKMDELDNALAQHDLERHFPDFDEVGGEDSLRLGIKESFKKYIEGKFRSCVGKERNAMLKVRYADLVGPTRQKTVGDIVKHVRFEVRA